MATSPNPMWPVVRAHGARGAGLRGSCRVCWPPPGPRQHRPLLRAGRGQQQEGALRGGLNQGAQSAGSGEGESAWARSPPTAQVSRATESGSSRPGRPQVPGPAPLAGLQSQVMRRGPAPGLRDGQTPASVWLCHPPHVRGQCPNVLGHERVPHAVQRLFLGDD